LLLALAAIFEVGLIVYSLQDAIHSLRDGSYFVSVSPQAPLPLLTALNLDAQSVIYDLGCGDNRILSFLYAAYPEATYRGIENNFIVYFLANFRNLKIRSGRFQILRKNFFAANLSDATHVVSYLPAVVLNKIYDKLKKEVNPGTIFATFDVPVTGVVPTKELASNVTLGSKIYLYTI
jgi:trans-aconitate methyltransferase